MPPQSAGGSQAAGAELMGGPVVLVTELAVVVDVPPWPILVGPAFVALFESSPPLQPNATTIPSRPAKAKTPIVRITPTSHESEDSF